MDKPDFKYLGLSERLEGIIETLKNQDSIESYVAFGTIFKDAIQETGKTQSELISFCAKNTKERLVFALAVLNLSNLDSSHINHFLDKDVMAKRILESIESFAINLNDYLAARDVEEHDSLESYVARYNRENTQSVFLK